MLALALKQAYPGIILGFDKTAECVVENINGVETITYWNRPEPEPDEAAVIAAYNPKIDEAIRKREEIYREQEIRSANIQMLSGMPLGFELPRTVIDILEETYAVILKSTARNAITASAPFWFGCKALRDNRNTLMAGLEAWVNDPAKTAEDIAEFDVVNWAGWSIERP